MQLRHTKYFDVPVSVCVRAIKTFVTQVNSPNLIHHHFNHWLINTCGSNISLAVWSIAASRLVCIKSNLHRKHQENIYSQGKHAGKLNYKLALFSPVSFDCGSLPTNSMNTHTFTFSTSDDGTTDAMRHNRCVVIAWKVTFPFRVWIRFSLSLHRCTHRMNSKWYRFSANCLISFYSSVASQLFIRFVRRKQTKLLIHLRVR